MARGEEAAGCAKKREWDCPKSRMDKNQTAPTGSRSRQAAVLHSPRSPESQRSYKHANAICLLDMKTGNTTLFVAPQEKPMRVTGSVAFSSSTLLSSSTCPITLSTVCRGSPTATAALAEIPFSHRQ